MMFNLRSVVVAVVLTLVIAGMPTAQAGPTSERPDNLGDRVGAASLGVGHSASMSNAGVRCHAKANQPHPSRHVKGTVNTTGHIECSKKVRKIKGLIFLYRRGHIVEGDTKTRRDTKRVNFQVAVKCSKRRRIYYTIVAANITYKNGEKGTVLDESKKRALRCRD